MRHFDCASAGEVSRWCGRCSPTPRSISCIPLNHGRRSAKPIGVMTCAISCFDSASELAKILARDRGRCRSRPGRSAGAAGRCGAVYDLSGKFGAPVEEAAQAAARRLVRWRVGSASQLPCRLAVHGPARLSPCPCSARLRRSVGPASTIDIVDVGGGFPVSYPDLEPPPLGAYFSEIEGCFRGFGPARRPGFGPSPVGPWLRPARRSWSKCSCGVATRSMSMTASMAACPMLARRHSGFRHGVVRALAPRAWRSSGPSPSTARPVTAPTT